MNDVREQVRQRYALAAVQASGDGCCGGSGGCGPSAVDVDETFGAGLYSAEAASASAGTSAAYSALYRPAP